MEKTLFILITMIELFITISTFSSMVLLFKYFEIIRINNLQAITANYFTAGILSILNLSFNIKLSGGRMKRRGNVSIPRWDFDWSGNK